MRSFPICAGAEPQRTAPFFLSCAEHNVYSGATFGPDQPVNLHLLDLNIEVMVTLEHAKNAFGVYSRSCEQAVQTNLGGVKMELEDATYPLLKV
jgi:hypothetical protein